MQEIGKDHPHLEYEAGRDLKNPGAGLKCITRAIAWSPKHMKYKII